MRPSNRNINQIRPVSIKTDIIKNAEGSCNIKCGNTEIICTATIDENVPHFIRKTGLGWVTAEYGMLPRSTNSRMKRESSRGKQGGRTLEIQRLIGRSLRTCVDRLLLGEREIIIDCDVIQADGGTRTASISGAWIALYEAIKFLMSKGKITRNPIKNQVAAISCGIINEEIFIDLDYNEDSNATVDGNFVLTDNKEIIEIQSSSEQKPISKSHFLKMYELVEDNIDIIFKKQRDILSS